MKTQLIQIYSIFLTFYAYHNPTANLSDLGWRCSWIQAQWNVEQPMHFAPRCRGCCNSMGWFKGSIQKTIWKPHGNPWKTKFLVHGSPHFTTRNLVFQCFANVSGKISTSYSVTLLLLGRFVNAVDLQRRMLLFRMPDVCLNCLCHFAWPGSFDEFWILVASASTCTCCFWCFFEM